MFGQPKEKPAFAEEARSTGSVSLAVYWEYFRAGGGYLSFFFFVLSCLITQFAFSGSDYWLTIWTNAEERRYLLETNATNGELRADNSTLLPSSENNTNGSFVENWWMDPDTTTGIYIFTIFIVGVFIFSMIRTVHFFVMCMVSSVNLHNKMFKSVIRAPLLFFDKNPVGKLSELYFPF